MPVANEDYEEFRCEAVELIDVAEKSLLAIDDGSDFKSTFDAVFRCFHNLKGAAGLIEMLELQEHTHELETKLLTFKESSAIPKEYVTLFLQGLDRARAMIDGTCKENADSSVETKPPAAEKLDNAPVAAIPKSDEGSAAPHAPLTTAPTPEMDSAVEEFFSECDETVQRVANHLAQIESQGADKEVIASLYRDFHSLKGSAFLFGFNTLGDIAHLIESSLEPVRTNGTTPSGSLVDAVFGSLKLIEMEAMCLRTGKPNEKIRELMSSLAKALKTGANSLVTEPAITPALTSAPTPAPSIPPSPVSPAAKATPAPVPAADPEGGSIRVSVGLLDNLMTLVGEMVLVRNQVIQFSNHLDSQEFSNLSKRLNTVTGEIQDGMMKTRMQPIGNVLNKFARVARDLSHELGKKINVVLSGTETELDKSLLEAIKDPLTHIVRNSCDHGIETPAVRLEMGKPETGTLSIRSYHEGGQVIIEVRDDGKGLHAEVLLKKGLEKGLITEAQSKTMSEREIFQLIFAAGFSTAAKVTNVSGRGVGMDVVRTNIEKIGGSVELQSVAGIGTTTLIKIPLTLAIVPALVVNHGGGTFAIPQVKLHELVRVETGSANSKIEYLENSPVYRLRGNLLPLVDLSQILGLKDREPGQLPATANIAVLNADGCQFGLIVDEIHDTADIVVKPLSRSLKSLPMYSGATVLGDGSIALILDVLGLYKCAQKSRGENSSVVANGHHTATKSTRTESQDYILVKVGCPTKHAIVLSYVHRLEEFKRSDIEVLGSKRVIRYRGALLHVVSADQQLGYSKPSQALAQAPGDMVPIVVIERAGSMYGIEVHEIIDTLSTPVDPNPGVLKQAGIYGTLNTSNELIIVIDPFELIQSEFGEKPPEKPASVEFANPATRTRSLKILLAEDTVFFKKAISLVLSKAGHQITYAADGQEALEAFLNNGGKYDLIVSDIDMPRMNGFDLARNIRKGNTHPSIPMLAVSSRGGAPQISEGLAAGFDIYMEKLKPDLLLKSVGELANRKEAA